MTWEEGVLLFHGADWTGVKAGLARIRELLRLLGDPQEELRFVHIAGTNGKGSSAAMLLEILIRAGYRTGRYISPHLVRVNERFSVDGAEISDTEFADLASIVRAATDQMDEKPTNFELFTALSFLWFQQKKCDIVVLEVGLGGRFDATNVIGTPLVALIMRIGLEHTEQLGDTLAQIAFEKAGIIKAGGDVVLCAQPGETERVVREVCAARGADLVVTDLSALSVQDRGTFPGADGTMPAQTFSYRDRRDLRLALLGNYQTENAAAVLDAVDVLKTRHGLTIPEAAIRAGLAEVCWAGRFQLLCRDPLFIVDGAHNPDGVRALAGSVRTYFAGRRMIFLMGVMADKDYREMLEILAPVCDPAAGGVEVIRFFAVSPGDARALAPDVLEREIVARFACPVTACNTIAEGVTLALAEADANASASPVVLAFGSLYQAGELLRIFRNLPPAG